MSQQRTFGSMAGDQTGKHDPAVSASAGRDWHFGMKVHVGTDLRGVVHHVKATDAAAADITQLPDLRHGEEADLYGDLACGKEDHREQ